MPCPLLRREPCLHEGACCLGDQCLVCGRTDCSDYYGGNYLGDGFPCAPNPCPFSSSVQGGLGNQPPTSLTAVPNPSSGTIHVLYRLLESEPIRLEILDASGMVVREFRQDRQSAGSHVLRWDGCDEAGRPLPSGVYLMRMDTRGGVSRGKVTLTR